MELFIQLWGEGSRTAILVHGATDDHTTWHRVAPHLVSQGFRVLAPDLRGHGRSERADSYRLADFAADLVDSLPRGADLLMCHSLGALAVGLAAEELAPKGIVYLDPPWRTSLPEAEEVAHDWSAEDQAVELASLARTDPALADWIPERLLSEVPSAIPDRLIAPTLVLEPVTGPLVEPAVRARLRSQGFVFQSVPGVGHVMHRDDLGAFLTAVDAWTSRPTTSVAVGGEGGLQGAGDQYVPAG